MAGAAGAGAGAAAGSEAGADAGIWSQAAAGIGFDDGCGLRRYFRLDLGICGLHGDGCVCNCGFNLNLRRVLILDARLCLDGRGCHGGDASVGVLGVIDDRKRDGRLRRLGFRRRLGSVLIGGLVGLIVLGLVAKDITVLERSVSDWSAASSVVDLGASLSSAAASCSDMTSGSVMAAISVSASAATSIATSISVSGSGSGTASTAASGSGRLTCLGRTALRSFSPRFFFL